MQVFILTEGGKNKGFGHVVRCSSLYHAFELKNISPKFFINGDESIFPLLTEVDFSLKNWLNELPQFNSSDIVIIDSYLANEELYKDIFSITQFIVSFDDNNRINYPGGIVINGNVLSEDINYNLENNIKYLLGSKYSCLRKEFWEINPIKINKTIENILVTLGGDDIRNLTPNILKLINEKFPQIKKTVIIGSSFRNIHEIENECDKKTQLIYFPDSKEMLDAMINADIAISAGGQTTYEFARIGLPSIAISIAENQTDSILNWERLGFLEYAGLWDDKNLLYNLFDKINKLFNFECRKKKHYAGISIIDGLGAKRVVEEVLNEQ